MPQTITTTKSSFSQPLWLTILRIVLGIILIWKGFNFIRDTAHLKSMIEQTGVGVFSKSSGAFASIVSILTLLCGFFITVGLFTKASCIVQIPIVILAIIFVHTKNIEGNSFELILTIIVLGLLALFAIKGSGSLSADEYFRRGAAIDKKKSESF
jgi:putative oxidoreductase